MKVGDKVFFTGWRHYEPSLETKFVRDRVVEIVDFDEGEQSHGGCMPDRYTVRFDDGVEVDCIRECLRGLYETD